MKRPSNPHRATDSLRVVAVARATYGSALLIAPRPILGLFGRERPHRGAVAFARILGARQLTEAILLELHGSESWIAAGAAVDAIHAITALALAGLRDDAEQTNDLLANAAVATALALEGLRLARRRR